MRHQHVLWNQLLRVDEQPSSLVDQLVGSLVTAAEQRQADREHAVPDCSRVSPRARKKKKEKLYVRQQEDQRPRPCGEWRQASDDALGPADDRGWTRGGPVPLHLL